MRMARWPMPNLGVVVMEISSACLRSSMVAGPFGSFGSPFEFDKFDLAEEVNFSCGLEYL